MPTHSHIAHSLPLLLPHHLLKNEKLYNYWDRFFCTFGWLWKPCYIKAVKRVRYHNFNYCLYFFLNTNTHTLTSYIGKRREYYWTILKQSYLIFSVLIIQVITACQVFFSTDHCDIIKTSSDTVAEKTELHKQWR